MTPDPLAGAGFWFDEKAAQRVVAFIEGFLRHSKGVWAGERFTLQPWQQAIMRELFGWKRADGTRRYRSAYIEIPRKNGKSALCSAIALYLLLADGEAGAEVYSAAADRDQAGIVYEVAKQMVQDSPALSRRVRIFKRSMVVQSTHSSYKVLSAEAYSKHGLNASAVIFDELHAQPNRELFDVLQTSMGARSQPLLVNDHHGGLDRNSICWEQHALSTSVIADPMVAPTHFGFIAAAGESDDWTSPGTWAKANPGLGVTLTNDYLAEQCNRALQTPGYQNTFQRLHLNIWTQQDVRWLDMRLWDLCQVEAPDLSGRVCYGGLDLANTHDLAALALVFPPIEEGEPWHVRVWHWIPTADMQARIRRDRVPYDVWQREGWIEATPGDVIDFERIIERIVELRGLYDIAEIAFDRWGARQIRQQLEDQGFVMVDFGQGFVSMAHPTSALARMVASRELGHDGNPVLRWAADNLVVQQDAAGNVKPAKNKSREKIDGLVAAIMGLERALVNEQGASMYDQGLIVL